MNRTQIATAIATLIALLPITADSKPEQRSQRYPTEAELKILAQRLKQAVDQMPQTIQSAPVYSEQRTPVEKQRVQAFVKAWSKLDPPVAPFLGQRQVINTQRIYPSRTRGQVCIIESYWFSDTDNGVQFSTGTVEAGKLRTTAGQILWRDRDYLGAAYIKASQPQLNIWPYPTLVQPPAQIDTLKYNQLVLQQFQAAKCLAELP